MNAKSKRELVDKIELEIRILRKDIERLKELTAPIAPENAIGRVSRMDAINNRSVNEAARRKTVRRLKSLELALERSTESSFGLCRGCGAEIPMGRLLLLPESVLCVQCAQRT